MKPIYSLKFKAILTAVLVLLYMNGFSQCPNSGPGGSTFFDTTINVETGVSTTPVKFAQFNPTQGMVTCVRLCVTIIGVVDTIGIQNRSTTNPLVANIAYHREDNIAGPGLISDLSNTVNQNFNNTLTRYDGISYAGSDFTSSSDDTVLQKVLCATTNDMGAIGDFYGTDSVEYEYTINASVAESYSVANKESTVLTSAVVQFHFEYCTCPIVILPLNIRDFDVERISDSKVDLKWKAFDNSSDQYYYEAQVSRDGHNFTSVAKTLKNSVGSDYKVRYEGASGKGKYYFRIKQVHPNGYVRYSNIRQITLESFGNVRFSVYPNPSNGVVGIKFDNISDGQFDLQIFNTQGQMMMKKEVSVSGSSYVQVSNKLSGGVYWVRLTDKKTLASSVNQLLIK